MCRGEYEVSLLRAQVLHLPGGFETILWIGSMVAGNAGVGQQMAHLPASNCSPSEYNVGQSSCTPEDAGTQKTGHGRWSDLKWTVSSSLHDKPSRLTGGKVQNTLSLRCNS